MQVRPLSPNVGALIEGVDLRQPLSDKDVDAIYRAVLDNLVVFFRDQDITPEQHVAFARLFGELEPPHPVFPYVAGVTIIEHDAARPADDNIWHSDVTFKKEPPFASILHAQEIPASGGDTMWASMYAAYDALPESLKKFVGGLTAVHGISEGWRRNALAKPNGIEKLRHAESAMGPVEHPVVKFHQVTGRPALFVNRPFTWYIKELPKHLSESTLAMLLTHIERPEFQVRFALTKKAIAFWDNRAAQHYALGDYHPHYRRMHRITLLNDRRAAAHATPISRAG